jgi:hypothetical protein
MHTGRDPVTERFRPTLNLRAETHNLRAETHNLRASGQVVLEIIQVAANLLEVSVQSAVEVGHLIAAHTPKIRISVSSSLRLNPLTSSHHWCSLLSKVVFPGSVSAPETNTASTAAGQS